MKNTIEQIIKGIFNKSSNWLEFKNYLLSIVNEVPVVFQAEINRVLEAITPEQLNQAVFISGMDKIIDIEIVEPNYSTTELELIPVPVKKEVPASIKIANHYLEENIQLKECLNSNIERVKELEAENIELKEEIEALKSNLKPSKTKKPVVPKSKDLKTPVQKDDIALRSKLKDNLQFNIETSHLELVGTLNAEEIKMLFNANLYTTKKQNYSLEYVRITNTIQASNTYELLEYMLEKEFTQDVFLHMDLLKNIKSDVLKYADTIKIYTNGTHNVLVYNNRAINVIKEINTAFPNFKDIVDTSLKFEDVNEFNKEQLEILVAEKTEKFTTTKENIILNTKQILKAIKIAGEKANYKNKNSAIVFNTGKLVILVMPLCK